MLAMLSNNKLALVVAGAVCLVGGYFVLAAIGPEIVTKTNEFLQYIEHDVPPLVGALALMAVIAISTPAFMSTTPFNFAAGAMFGIWIGTVVMLAGCVIGSLFNFLIARYLARDWAKRKTEQSEMLSALDAAVAQKGFSIIFLSRLSPVFPFAMTSFMFGVCAVSILDYTLATALGLLPGIVMYCWIGISMKNLAATGGADWTLYVSIAFSLVSIVLISKQAQTVISEATKASDNKRAL
mmetsp:Transcript_22593/g.49491  ORF Transcript_22593/g.49491 Transcript_22593/m.49491 type:complete len:239 (-) Transcript_22593:519-1235(-)